MHTRKVALVTGANKGLGFEIARQLGRRGFTFLGARDERKGALAADELRAEGFDAHPAVLDVTSPAHVEALPRFLGERFGRLDVLVNNAGVLLDRHTPPSSLDPAVLRATFDANFFGAFAVA